MKLEPLRNGCLKIWMTETDMQRFGLQFDRMNAQDDATKRTLLKLINLAQERYDLRSLHDILVEVLPLVDGCLLLFSPVTRPKHIPQPTVYCFDNADALLQFGKTIKGHHSLPPASLYALDEKYHLILYAGFEPTRHCRTLLSEFAEALHCDTAYTEEHGRALAIGNALETLTGRGSPSPTRPDPPH